MIYEKGKKILSLPISAALFLLFIGYWFVIFNMQFSFYIYLIGLVTVGVLYILRYFFKVNKTVKDTAKLIMVISWVLITVLSFYGIFHLLALQVLSMLAGGIWLISEVIDKIKHESQKERMNVVLWIGLFFMVISVIFRILFLPHSAVLQLTGMLFSSAGFYLMYNKKLKSRLHKEMRDVLSLNE